MGKISNYIRHLQQFTETRQERDILNIMANHSDEAIDLNLKQLFAGKDGNGDFLESYRSKAYAEMKLHLNPAGVTDLKLTGAFYSRWYFNSQRFPATFGSTDPKAKDLEDKYGSTIYILDKDNKREFVQEDIKPDIIDYYKKTVFRL